jgi:hypothetical protein
MSTITSVGIREFRSHLYKYTKENQEPIALTSHEETIGYYIPAQPQTQKKLKKKRSNLYARLLPNLVIFW